MHSQLRLNRVGDGLGGLIDSVIVRVGTDRSHVWEGKEGRGKPVDDGGSGGREEEMNGQRAGEVRAWRQSTWQQLASKSETQKECGQTPSKGTREKGGKEKEKRKGKTFGTTGRKRKGRDAIKEGRKGREETYRGEYFGSLRFAGID